MAGRVESLGKPGRKQEYEADSDVNLVSQKPSNFIAPTTNATEAVVGEVFVISGSHGTDASVGTVVNAFTVPAGWATARLLEAKVRPISGIASTTLIVKAGATSLTDAAAAATADTWVPFKPVDGVWDLSAGDVVTLTYADNGSTRPAAEFYFLLQRTA